MLTLQCIFQNFFPQEKYLWARRTVIPSAEHLLLAQQQAQPQTHAHSRHLNTANTLWHWCQRFPLWNFTVSLCDLSPQRSLRELWCLLQEMAAPCEGCHLVPRAVLLLTETHEIQACCWRRFVPHSCYVAAKNNSPPFFLFAFNMES